MNVKKIVTLMLALALVLSLTAPALAAEADETLTRGEFVLELYAQNGSDSIDPNQEVFDDIPATGDLAQAIRWARTNGVVNGYGDGRFGPDDPVTREQMAAMLYRYAQALGKGFQGLWMFPLEFADAAEVSEWANEAMHWVVMKGIIIGTDKGLEPKATATDDQLSLVLQRWQEALKAEGDDGQNPVMNFVGEYACDRARARVEAEGKEFARVVIQWSNSVSSLAQWVMSGKLDLDTLRVDYSNCIKTELTYNSNGELESETQDYENGTGSFVFGEGSTFTWHDDQEDRDLVFQWSFEPNTEGEGDDGQNPVMNFVGEYACDRAKALVEAEGKEFARVVIRWSGSVSSLAQWVMSGKLDLDTLRVDYSNCIKTELTYNSNGELESETQDYENGTGSFVFGEDSTFTWHDDQEGRELVFQWAPSAETE